MSIPVKLDALRAEIDGFVRAPYLLTVGGDGRAHSVAVPVVWRDGLLVVAPGNRTMANAAERPLVSLVFAPNEPDGYSLIVDTRVVATTADGAGGNEVVLEPTGAVLHRPAVNPSTEPGACGADCLPVGRTER